MTTITMKEVAAFLMGEAPLDGFWFGERHPAGGFWWREHLRAALAVPATAQAAEIARLKAESEERLQNCAALVAEVERLRKDADALRIDAELWREHDAEKTARYARFIAKLNDGETP